MAKLFFFDIETTRLNPKLNAIHQLSFTIEIDGIVKEQKTLNIIPDKDLIIDAEALKISNKTEEDVQNNPLTYIEAYNVLKNTICTYIDKFNKFDKLHLVGYNNIKFDNEFLREFFIKNNDKYFGSLFWSDSIDIMSLASNLLKENRSGMIDFKLKTVATKLGIEIDQEKLHDATYDLYLTMQIYKLINP